VQSTFATVVWVVCGVGFVLGFVALVSSGKAWDDYGKNRLLLDSDLSRVPSRGSAAALLERDTEIRELLEARNERRRRRGEPAIDVEDELKRLTAPQIDDELRAEIRDLVHARNARRARAGKPPLDVEAEIAREIASLSEL
jgi:hypothetical protein